MFDKTDKFHSGTALLVTNKGSFLFEELVMFGTESELARLILVMVF